MAFVLRSNITVSDPNGKYPYYTRFGPSPGDVSRFMIALEAAGYDLTESEFFALKAFVEGLEDDGIYSRIHEIYPLMGNSIETAAIKLRGMISPGPMIPINGLSDDHLEIVDGRVVGKAASAPSLNGTRRFGTGVTVGSLMPACGFHILAGGGSGGGRQPMLGTLVRADSLAFGAGVDVVDGTRLDGYYRSETKIGLAGGWTGAMALYSVVCEPNVTPGLSTRPTYYRDGVRIGENSFSLISGAADAELAFFGRNSYGGQSGAGSDSGFSGKIRFGAITKGDLGSNAVSQLNDRVRTLAIALGKI